MSNAPSSPEPEVTLHPGIIALIVFVALVAFVIFVAIFCKYYRTSDRMVERYGVPDLMGETAVCYCYPEVWVEIFPSCIGICRRHMPRDRTQPYVAPGARFMTGSATEVTPPVRNAPPPSYDDSGAAPRNNGEAPPGYDNVAKEQDPPSYDQVQETNNTKTDQ